MEPKTQCKVCLSYWDIGIVYCTCGHFLRKGTEENKKFIKYTMDLLSIPTISIKKVRPHGHRYGKKPGDREYYIAHSLKKKCRKYYLGIHDRFIRDEKFRKNMIDNGRTEEICRQMDDLADEDHTHNFNSRRNSRLQKQLVDSFEHNWFRYNANPAQIWLQTSIVYLATVKRQRRWSSTQPKMDAKLFFVLVELARIMVEVFWSDWDTYSRHDFQNSPALLQLDRLQLTAVYCNRRGV